MRRFGWRKAPHSSQSPSGLPPIRQRCPPILYRPRSPMPVPLKSWRCFQRLGCPGSAPVSTSRPTIRQNCATRGIPWRCCISREHELTETRGVAVVGSREATEEGRRRAAKISRALVEKGFTVVSGLALGIDAAAHTAAIEAWLFDSRTPIWTHAASF